MDKISNGVYLASHVSLGGGKRRLCVFNDKVRVYTLNGNYVAVMSIDDAIIHYGTRDRWFKEEKRNKLYNIAWMIEGHVRETISVNATFGVVRWKIKQLKAGGVYNCGLLLPVISNLS